MVFPLEENCSSTDDVQMAQGHQGHSQEADAGDDSRDRGVPVAILEVLGRPRDLCQATRFIVVIVAEAAMIRL
jgi:hypothetical protein